MNQRIRELAEQATQLMLGRPDLDIEYVMEKFGELIVFECSQAVQDGTKEGDHYSMRIEQHFNNSPGGVLHYGDE